jgi:hypothetical protein
MHKLVRCSALSVSVAVALASVATAADFADALAAVRAVGPEGKGHAQAVAAAQSLSKADGAQLSQILAGMDGANEIATNWLRVAAEAVAQRAIAANSLPKAELERFLAETKHSPRARRLAFEFVAQVDPTAEKRLIPTLLDDPSLELRRDAVAQLLAETAQTEPPAKAVGQYQKAFYHSRDLDQIKESAAKLKEAGEAPDIASHMGYVMTWKLLGPFDNTGDKGWDTAYPPEAGIDLAAEYDGQKGKVRWTDHTTADDYGLVDLNKVQGNHKGAVTYAYVEFVADKDRPCQLRLGSINANKIWLNGQLLTANHVYHAGDEIDQYIARGTLKKGKNTILLKICQNEQTEAWAQKWQFQLRVCDEIGTAILSQDRAGQKVAVLVR